MKYLLFSLLLLPLGLMAQKKYAPLNAVWGHGRPSIDCTGPNSTYKVEKEITVDGKDCSVIYCYTASNVNTTPIKEPDSLIVWENENKIYFLEGDDFYLMYDFTAEVGDTVSYFSPINKPFFSSTIYQSTETSPHQINFKITSIESIILNDIERKKFHCQFISTDGVSIGWMSSFIENIGSTGSLLTGDTYLIVDKGCTFGRLQCYNNGNIEYLDIPTSDEMYEFPHPNCDIPDSSSDIDNWHAISIFPNPVSNELFIESSTPVLRVQVFNTNQQLMKTVDAQNTIWLNDLAKGMYIIGVETREGQQYFKVVKEE